MSSKVIIRSLGAATNVKPVEDAQKKDKKVNLSRTSSPANTKGLSVHADIAIFFSVSTYFLTTIFF